MSQAMATTTTLPVTVLCSGVSSSMAVTMAHIAVDLAASGELDVHTDMDLAATSQHDVALATLLFPRDTIIGSIGIRTVPQEYNFSPTCLLRLMP